MMYLIMYVHLVSTGYYTTNNVRLGGCYFLEDEAAVSGSMYIYMYVCMYVYNMYVEQKHCQSHSVWKQ
jgi:hypothetical protein